MKRKYITIGEAFLNKCPVTGGICLNPMCIAGCIEN